MIFLKQVVTWHRTDLFTCSTVVARFLAYCSRKSIITVAVLLIIWAIRLRPVIFTGRLKIMIIMILLLYWSIPRKKNALPPGSNNRKKKKLGSTICWLKGKKLYIHIFIPAKEKNCKFQIGLRYWIFKPSLNRTCERYGGKFTARLHNFNMLFQLLLTKFFKS